MTKNKRSRTEKVSYFLQLQTRQEIFRTLLGVLIGVVSYIVLYLVKLPSYKFMSLITVQIDIAILIIPITATFFGPLVGLLVGMFGTLGADILFTQHIIALGIINLSYGLLGFIAGIPHYTKVKGFPKGKTLGKIILFTMTGLLVMALVYLGALILVVGQNFLAAFLYNFLPFFSVSLITLLTATPIAIWLADILANYARKRIL